MKAAIWLRVSTDEQTTANQLAPLAEYAERRGLEVVEVFDISGVSAFGGKQDVFLRKVYEQARRGKFQVLLCWSLDRLSRDGIEHVLRTVRRFDEVGCQIWSLQESWTEVSGELRSLLFSVTAWVAQMESKRRSERTKAGMARAKAAGRHVGRPRKRGVKGIHPPSVANDSQNMGAEKGPL